MNKILAVILLLLITSCISLSSKTKITGIYSSLHYTGEETGDIVGTEIIIMQCGDAKDYYITFQDAEGMIKAPIVIKPIINNQQIEFDVPQSSYTESGKEIIQIIRYVGQIKENGIEIETQGVSGSFGNKELLKRNKSYWE